MSLASPINYIREHEGRTRHCLCKRLEIEATCSTMETRDGDYICLEIPADSHVSQSFFEVM